MSVFMLDTDSVSASASSLDSLAKQVLELFDKVNSYDTNCQEFNFSSAKTVIANNIEACSIKIANTSGIMNSVVSSHTSLQSKMQFKSSEEKAAEEAAKAKKAQGSSGSGYYGGGGYSSGGYSGGGYSSGSYSSALQASAAQVTPLVSISNELIQKPTATGPVEVKASVEKFYHAKVVLDDLTGIGKSLFGNSDLIYNRAGYATIGGMFVIACSKAYGKVGDVVEFTLDDGQTFKCIIGQIDEEVKDGLRFFVNDEWKEDGDENFKDNIGEHITKIENFGVDKTYAVESAKTSAVEWVKEIASDDTHGYSQTSRWGDPNYDCSSFIISAFEEAGIPVKDAGATYTGNMKEAFLQSGFEWIPGTPDVNDLQPGDVLLRVGYHTEMYVGDGKMIGAHSNSDGQDGDSSGGEISASDYTDKKWDGVLRYVGNTVEVKSSTPAAPNVTTVSEEKKTMDEDEKTNEEETSSEKEEENQGFTGRARRSEDDLSKLLRRISGSL